MKSILNRSEKKFGRGTDVFFTQVNQKLLLVIPNIRWLRRGCVYHTLGSSGVLFICLIVPLTSLVPSM